LRDELFDAQLLEIHLRTDVRSFQSTVTGKSPAW
jgi:hypothetical protein